MLNINWGDEITIKGYRGKVTEIILTGNMSESAWTLLDNLRRNTHANIFENDVTFCATNRETGKAVYYRFTDSMFYVGLNYKAPVEKKKTEDVTQLEAYKEIMEAGRKAFDAFFGDAIRKADEALGRNTQKHY